MNEPAKKTIDGKQITVFQSETAYAPIVYTNMVMDSGEAILCACKMLGCKPFHLVTITKLHWDEELSPWAHEPVVSKNDRFTGGADEYVRCITERIIPYAESILGQPQRRIIAGYSMAGLFALYAPYITDAFDAVVSASGSAWYPGFVGFVKTHEYLKKPSAIYLSLGDLECRTNNPYLSQTENCMRTLHQLYTEQSISSVFKLNPGNHFKDAPLRLAKGIVWELKQL